MSGTRLAFLRPFTTRVVNPISRRIVGYLPFFGLVVVAGRRTGLIRRVPMNVFRVDGDYVLALTYGRDVDWVRNVLAAGGCRLVTGGRTVEVRDPIVVNDPGRRLVPRPVRFVLGLLGVDDFLRLRPVVSTT